MKVLFIGGTGIISTAVSELALENGISLYHLNRGTSKRFVPGVENITCDYRNLAQTREKLKGLHFDVVVDWICFTPDQAKRDIDLFSNKTNQFIFISSASAYQNGATLPVTENTPLENPLWEYSRNKIACEQIFWQAYDKEDFPITIVRPSHTYDKTLLPFSGGFTTLRRIIDNKEVVIHGDGNSIWTITNSKDFAVGLTGLLGNKGAIGEDFHITNNELITWNQIFNLVAKEFNREINPVYLPSEFIAKYNSDIGDSLLGDKSYSMIFDNSKIKKYVPEFRPKINFSKGVKEIADYYKLNMENFNINKDIDNQFNQMIYDYKRI